MEDFKQIAKNAQEMSILSQTAEWQVYPTSEYKQHSTEFRRATDELAWHAKSKNLDAAALSYVQITLTCDNCHKHVRTIRVAEGLAH